MADFNIPKHRCFSLGDFHDFDSCLFRYFVKHNLDKKYEIEEGSANQAIGSLLDLSIKNFHNSPQNNNWSEEDLRGLIKDASLHMRDKVSKSGPLSYFGPQVPFINDEVLKKAEEIFVNYYQKRKGKIGKNITKNVFWKEIIFVDDNCILWGGPDTLEVGEDGVIEVVDYKYFENQEKGQSYLDMDLMPKLYVFLCAKELLDKGYKKTRFKVRFWNDPENESFYEEFDLSKVLDFKDYFKDKIKRALTTNNLTFCEKDWCKVCKSEKREEWVKELVDKNLVVLD